MAKQDSTQATTGRSARFKEMDFNDLVDMLETRSAGANEKSEKIIAIAFGGFAHAGYVKPDGDAIDITSKYMFEAITDIGGDCTEYYESKDLLAEMRARLKHIATPAGKAEA